RARLDRATGRGGRAAFQGCSHPSVPGDPLPPQSGHRQSGAVPAFGTARRGGARTAAATRARKPGRQEGVRKGRSPRTCPGRRRKDELVDYGMTVRLKDSYAEAVERVSAALKEQGFGVLTEIDARATLEEKLGEKIEDYLILGACNPPLAHRALNVDRRIGLLLPCNVVVRTEGDDTLVEVLDPQVMAKVSEQPGLEAVADEAARRLTAALDSLRG